MDSITVKELWMLLGEKDVQIYQLLKTLEAMRVEIEKLREKDNGGLEHSSTD